MDLLDLKEPQSDVCYITVIPTVEKDAIESDSDCSDREYQGDTGHLPAILLNGEEVLTHLEDEKDFNLMSPEQLDPPPTF